MSYEFLRSAIYPKIGGAITRPARRKRKVNPMATPTSSSFTVSGVLGNQQIYVIDETVLIGGDLIIAINGNKVINGDYLISYLEENTIPEQIVELTIMRDDQIFNVPVELGRRLEII